MLGIVHTEGFKGIRVSKGEGGMGERVRSFEPFGHNSPNYITPHFTRMPRGV
jgi:hypothetical protein